MKEDKWGIIQEDTHQFTSIEQASNYTKDLKELGKMLGMDVKGMEPEAAALAAIEKFEGFLKELGVQTRLSECDVPESGLDELVEDSVRVYFSADGTLAARTPLSKEDVKAILELAL